MLETCHFNYHRSHCRPVFCVFPHRLSWAQFDRGKARKLRPRAQKSNDWADTYHLRTHPISSRPRLAANFTFTQFIVLVLPGKSDYCTVPWSSRWFHLGKFILNSYRINFGHLPSLRAGCSWIPHHNSRLLARETSTSCKFCDQEIGEAPRKASDRSPTCPELLESPAWPDTCCANLL